MAILDSVFKRFGYEKTQQRIIDTKTTLVTEIAGAIGYDLKYYYNWMESYFNPNPIHRNAQWSYALYQEMDADGHIYNSMTTRKEALLCRNSVVRSAKPGDPLEDRKAALAYWCFDHIPQLIQKKRQVLSSSDYGFSVSELIFDYQDIIILPDGKQRKNSVTIPNAFVLTDIKTKVPSAFGFDGLGKLSVVSASAANSMFGISSGTVPRTLTPEEARHFLVVTHDPRFGSRYGYPLKSAFFWDYLSKKATRLFRMIFVEKYGMPWVTGSYPDGLGEPEVTKFFTMLKGMQKNSVAVSPEGFAIQLLEPSGKTGSIDVFQNVIDAADRNISEVCLGHAQATSEGDKGSPFGTTDSKTGLRQDKLEMDGAELDAAINDQIIPLLIDANFTPNGLYPYVKTIVEPEADLDKEMFRIQSAYNMKIPISLRQTREKMGWEEPDSPEDALLQKDPPRPEPPPKSPTNGQDGQVNMNPNNPDNAVKEKAL